MRKSIAVCGCPRSGNTAITQMLNLHNKVYLTDESGWMSNFNCERDKLEFFFTNKEVVGDKTPSYVLENHFSYIRCHHPEVKFIFTFRRCEDVVSSSLLHGKASKQEWAHDDVNDAISMWNEYTESTIRAINSLDNKQFCAINFEQESDRRIISKIESLIDMDLNISDRNNLFIRDKYYKYNYHLPLQTLVLNKKILEYI